MKPKRRWLACEYALVNTKLDPSSLLVCFVSFIIILQNENNNHNNRSREIEFHFGYVHISFGCLVLSLVGKLE